MAAAQFLRACYNVAIRRTIFTNVSISAPITMRMPALSPTMEEGTITKWLIAEGDKVEAGDALCEVETDKAVVTMEATDDGTLAKIVVPEGTTNVKINVPIAFLAEEDEDVSVVANMKVAELSETADAPEVQAEQTTAQKHPETKTEPKRNLISPAVKRLLQQYDLQSNVLQGTGPKGILLKGDVLKFILDNGIKPKVFESPPPAPVATEQKTVGRSGVSSTTLLDETQKADNFTTIEVSGVRKVIAKRLTESKQTVPHSYSSIDCCIGKVLDLRKQLMKEGVKLSVNDFIIKAIAVSLRRFPDVNRVWNGSELEEWPTADISVAVATEGGLITPIVKNACSKGLQSISEEIRELAGRARVGGLKPHEFQGGSFTISNLGMFGVKEFTAVINPPQTSIMAVGTTRLMPAFSSTSTTNDVTDETASSLSSGDVKHVMTVTLSSDVRAMDSEIAFKFLSTFKRNIENPMLLGL